MCSIVLSSGIFIWWPSLKDINSTNFIVQLLHNDSSAPTKFSDQIIGTIDKLDCVTQWSDIQPKLIKVSATTNIYPLNDIQREKRSLPSNSLKFKLPLINSTDSLKNSTEFAQMNNAITEIEISGNVSGILLPNTKKIIVRVLVPVMDGNKKLYQNTTFVEWKTVSFIVLILK